MTEAEQIAEFIRSRGVTHCPDMPAAEVDPSNVCSRCGRRLPKAMFAIKATLSNICLDCAKKQKEAAKIIRAARIAGADVGDTIRPHQIFERDKWICGICGLPIDRTKKHPDPKSVSIDHRIPLCLGGEHSEANVQASHLRCNARKAQKLLDNPIEIAHLPVQASS